MKEKHCVYPPFAIGWSAHLIHNEQQLRNKNLARGFRSDAVQKATNCKCAGLFIRWRLNTACSRRAPRWNGRQFAAWKENSSPAASLLPRVFSMLLFGGSLSGGKKPDPDQKRSNETTVESSEADRKQHSANGGDAVIVVTPRTDILHRLTNHELRLLEELERTRSKLQAEWRHKLAAFQQQQGGGGANVPTVEQLTQQLPSPSKADDLKALMRSKTLVRKSNQSTKSILKHRKSRSNASNKAKGNSNPSSVDRDVLRLRSSLDMLPVLTTTGETPFELGLDEPSQQQHVLPIFRLPTVNVTGTATVLAQKEVEILEEDRDRKQASEALGLSLEEIALLEAGLNGGDKKNASGFPGQHGQDPSQYSPGNVSKKLPGILPQQLTKSKNRRQDRRQKSAKAGTQQASEEMQSKRSDTLRKELESALYNVQHLTRLVKDDIVFAQKICPANELRTSVRTSPCAWSTLLLTNACMYRADCWYRAPL